MTGPEHYQAAESLLNQVKAAQANMTRRPDPQTITDTLAEAQVHATLAAAAATAQGALVGSTPDGLEGMSERDMTAWNDVAGIPTLAKVVAA